MLFEVCRNSLLIMFYCAPSNGACFLFQWHFDRLSCGCHYSERIGSEFRFAEFVVLRAPFNFVVWMSWSAAFYSFGFYFGFQALSSTCLLFCVLLTSSVLLWKLKYSIAKGNQPVCGSDTAKLTVFLFCTSVRPTSFAHRSFP